VSNLVEQTARFLSGNRPPVQEKSLSDTEIEDLLDKGKEVATSISKDTKKSEEERNTAKDVLGWIRDVRKTWNKDNSLHPNAVTKLMKITAIRQGKWGYINNRGKIPSDFRR
tara:strand:- start:326 stop:661 length:336 start_codon:yes stop_codon:yes gene_type:complete